MNSEMIVLRLVHILCGMFWVGGVMLMSFFLMPALAGIGPAAGQVMAGLAKRKMMIVMPAVAILTVLSGLRLLMIDSVGFSGNYFQSPVGRAFSTAGGLAIIGFLLGMIVVSPAMSKAGTLGAQVAAATDETARAQLQRDADAARRRGAAGASVVLVLLILAAVGMATARYMG